MLKAEDQRDGISFAKWDEALEWGRLDELAFYTAVGE